MDPSTRWKLTLEYDGADFAGWGIQPRQRTVQGEVEHALEAFLHHPTRVEVAGRTDSGVHALGQVCALTTDVGRTPRTMLEGLNHYLPDDIACLHAEVVADDFDPRRQTRSKLYRYRWLERGPRSPMRRNYVWHIRRPLDVDAMHEAVQALAGTHDFRAFRASSCQAATTVRTIPTWRVFRHEDEVWLEATGHGFLQHMLRIVAGSLVEVGRGRRPPSWIGEIRDGGDRTRAGRTAPASGLTLVHIRYAESD